MGQEIVYCFKCQQRILGAEFEKGRAYQVGHHVCCSTCAPALLETLGPAERTQLITQMYQAIRSHAPAPPQPAGPPRVKNSPAGADRRKTTAHIPIVHHRPPAEGRSPLALSGAAAGAVLLMAVMFWVFSSPGSREPEPRRDSPAPIPASSGRMAQPPPAATPEDREIGLARAALEKARTFEAAHSRDLKAVMVLWEEAAKAAENTPFLREATKERDRVARACREAVSKDLNALEEQAGAALRVEEFKSALDLFQAARSRSDLPEWMSAIDRRSSEIREIAAQRYPSIREAAVSARKAGRAADVELVQARIRKWNLPEFMTDLE